MGELLIIEPEATENIADNPSAEVDASFYTAVGGSIVRTIDRARFGRASVRVTTNGAAIGEGVRYTQYPGAGVVSQPFTATWYVRGTGRVRIRFRDQTNGIERSSDFIDLNDLRWQRLEVTIRTGTSPTIDLRVFIETANYAQAVQFYVDGLQIENKDHSTTYADGDLELELDPHDGPPFFEWCGRRHESASTRLRSYRPGGRLRELTQGLHSRLYPIDSSGLGMPPVNLQVQRFAGQERVLVQSTRALPRSVGLTFWAIKDPATQVCTPASLRPLHAAREALEAVLKPDVAPLDQPMILRYLDGVGPLDLLAYYESGLEWAGDLRFPYSNAFGVRLFCPNPYWLEDTQDQINVDPEDTLTLNYIAARIDGEWTDLDGGMNGDVFAILAHSNGDIYAGGNFTSPAGRIALWDCEQWLNLDEDIDDGGVYAIAEAPNGDIYVGGYFLDIGGTTYNRIARYDVVNETWSQMGTEVTKGLNGTVSGIAVDRNGIVYITGNFTATAGGATTLNYVCSYDPSTNAFSALGGGPGLNARGRAVEIDIDGVTVYFAGLFTDIFGGPGNVYDYVIKWDGTNFSNMAAQGGGMDDETYVLRRTETGEIYAGGDFSNAGFAQAEKFAMWNRKEWYPLGMDADGAIGGDGRALQIDHKGELLLGGDFTSATRSPLSRALSVWDRTRFTHLDINLPGSPMVYAIAVKGGDYYIGFSTSGSATFSAIQTATNTGKASTWPILEVLGPARLEWLENQENGAIIRLDLDVQADERVLIDFRRGKFKAVSDFFGNVFEGVLPKSDLGEFRLFPGNNTLAFFAEDWNGDTEIVLRWQLAHWSFDAI